MRLPKNWIYPKKVEISQEIFDKITKLTDSKIITQLLVNRGITTVEKAKEFMSPEDIELTSPYLFPEMEKSVERILQAIEKQEVIVVYGDFDADGVTSTSLLYKTLKYLDANVQYYIPDRTLEGHGLNSASICRLISGKKAKLIITVDCGVSNHTEITLAKGLGTDVIITDHHTIPEIPPAAYSIINPKQLTEETRVKYLAGVGVAFKLAQALLETFNKKEFEEEILPLVSIGTIADVVPLLDENRTLVNRGLNAVIKNKPLNIEILLKSAGYKVEKGISSEMIAFGIAPRINAAGRLADASIAVELLVSDDAERIEYLTGQLDHNNRQRQKICEDTFVQADQKVNREIDLDIDKAIILFDESWHAGIIGIVASKMVEKYHKPTFLFSIDEDNKIARCSARGIPGLHLYEILDAHSNVFKHYGGHALAAGCVLDLEKISLEEFRMQLNQTVSANLNEEYLTPSLKVDANLSSSDLTKEFIENLEKIAPFGEGNPSPVFGMTDLTLKQFNVIGSNKNHLKIFVSDKEDNLLEAVWWQNNRLNAQVLDTVDVAFTPKINTFGEKVSIQLEVRDIVIDSENKPVQPVKWIDHRNKPDMEKALANFVKTAKTEIAIFAEEKGTLEYFIKDPLCSTKLINRINMKKADQLMLLDFPCDVEILSSLVKNTDAKVIHLIGKKPQDTNSQQLIKTLSGMLKYAHTNMDGKVNLVDLAIKLFTSNSVINACIELLNKAKIIKINNKNQNYLEFEFVKSTDMASIVNLSEYQFLNNALSKENGFKKHLASLELSKVKELINK